MPFFDSKKSFKDTCLLFLGRVGVGLGQIVSMRIITELISPSQIGLFYYVLAIGAIFSCILFQPIIFYTTRTFLVWFKEAISRNKLISTIKLLLWFTFFCCFIFFIYWHYFQEKNQIGLPYFTLVPVIILTGSLIGIGTSTINLLQMRKVFVIFTNLIIWSNLLLTFLLVVLVDKKAEMMLLGRMISQIIIAISVLYIVKKVINKSEQICKDSKMDWREVWKFSWPLSLTQILFWAQNSGYRIPLKINAGVHDLGIFSVTFGITIALFTMFQSVFTQLYDPIFWKNVADNGHKSSDLNSYMKNHWPYLVLFTFWVIGISAFALKVMAAGKYSKYYYFIMLIAVSELVRHLGMGLFNSTNAINKNEILILPGMFSFIVCLGGTYFLGRIINPIIATVVSMIIAYFLTLVMLSIFVRKSVEFKFPWKESGFAAIFGVILASVMLSIGLLGFSSTVGESIVVLVFGGGLFVLTSYYLSKVLSRIRFA